MNQSFVPLTFEVGIGRFRTVSSVDEAANYLLNDWPLDEGERYDFAKRVCLEAMEGRRMADEARAAFMLALDEAGMWVKS
jgi:hypothetical protein